MNSQYPFGKLMRTIDEACTYIALAITIALIGGFLGTMAALLMYEWRSNLIFFISSIASMGIYELVVYLYKRKKPNG